MPKFVLHICAKDQSRFLRVVLVFGGFTFVVTTIGVSVFDNRLFGASKQKELLGSCRPHWYPGSCMACLLRQGSQQPQKTLASGRLGSNLSKWGRQSKRSTLSPANEQHAKVYNSVLH